MNADTCVILIVEDDDSHVELIKDAFDEKGNTYEILTAPDLKTAREILGRQVPDLVIADIRLPDGEGTDLLVPLETPSRFPVIIMTGFGDERLAVDAMKAGALDYIVKSSEVFMDMPHIAQRAIREWRILEAHQSAETQSKRLAAAVTEAAESIMITDTKGSIQYVNPYFEKMTGYSSVEIIGKSPGILSSGRQNQAFYDNLWKTISAGITWQGRFINKKKDGSLFEETATISPVHDAKRNIINFVAVKRDTTQERMLENQVRQSQKMAAIGQLAHKVAHDFTNVLSVILGNAQLINVAEGVSHNVQQYVNSIIKASNKIAMLNAELMAFAHPAELQLKIIDLNKIVRGIEEILTRTLPQNVNVVLDIGTATGKVSADVSQIEQAVVHIAINAAEAMPEGGTLTIKTSRENIPREMNSSSFSATELTECTLLSIRDTGIGMSEETKARIFDPFFTTKKDSRNSGLGMSMAFKIIDQHGGIILVDSILNEGSCMRIYLPMVKKEN